MKITNEDIKAVQSRVDVTYEEAERFLIKADGDIERAVEMINRKRDSSFSKFLDEAKRIGAELLTYYFKIEKKENVYMNIPFILVVLFFVLVDVDTKIWVLVVSIGMILISESQVSIYKKEQEDEDMIIEKESVDEEARVVPTEPVVQPVQSVQEEIIESTIIEPQEAVVTNNQMSDPIVSSPVDDDDEDDDYYEITIEK